MRKHRVFSMAVFVFLFLMSSLLVGPVQHSTLLAQNPVKRHNLSIKKVKKDKKKVWRIVQSDDTTSAKVTVNRGDIVVWHIKGTDAFFQFSDVNLFGAYNAVLKNNKKLELTVGKDAKSGPNVYSVFCTSDSSFAVGDSPPVIIVE